MVSFTLRILIVLPLCAATVPGVAAGNGNFLNVRRDAMKNAFQFTPFTGSELADLDAWIERQDERLDGHFTRLRAGVTDTRETHRLHTEELLHKQAVRNFALKVLDLARAQRK